MWLSIDFKNKTFIYKEQSSEDEKVMVWDSSRLSEDNIIGFSAIMLKCKLEVLVFDSENINDENSSSIITIDEGNYIITFSTKMNNNANHIRFIDWRDYKYLNIENDISYLKEKLCKYFKKYNV